MRVALDVSSAPRQLGGAGRYIRELAVRLPDCALATTLVTRRADGDRWREWSPAADVDALVPNARVARLMYEAWALGASRAARAVDVWHAPHYTMPHRASTPVVVTIHDLTYFTAPQWHERTKATFFRRAITYAARHADVLISVSDFTARQLDQWLPDHGPVVVAPLGVDLERFAAVTSGDDDAHLRAHGLDSDVPYVLFLGTLEPRKGLDVLLDAFAEVARDDATIELWLAGQRGWGIETLDVLVRSHPANQRIRRLGFVDDDVLPALLRRARAVAYPSRAEGFGLPVLEALACGAIVVTSEETVMADVAGGAATLVSIGDRPGLARALLESLHCGDDERHRRALVGRRRAELFTWDRMMAQHVAAYNLAVGGS